MSIAKLCEAAVATGKVLQNVKESILGDREKQLLAAASETGIFNATQSDRFGRFVVAGNMQFTEDDPADTAHYLDAFLKLCDRGLVIHWKDDLFRLSGHGFNLARSIAEKRNGR